MGRVHLVETGDLPWFPAALRDAETDLLEWTILRFGLYDPVVPLLARCLGATQASEVLDLGSGAGGPWARLLPRLSREVGREVRVELTDLFPNVPALERQAQRAPGRISFRREPVDATRVGSDGGVRTLFTAFHHFKPPLARRILEDAVRSRAAIGVFEFNARTLPALLGILAAPLVTWAATPLLRPVRLSRLALTYALPVIPLNVLWNGTISNLRTYAPDELRDLTHGLEGDGCAWEAGRTPWRGALGAPVTYLVGLPGGSPERAR